MQMPKVWYRRFTRVFTYGQPYRGKKILQETEKKKNKMMKHRTKKRKIKKLNEKKVFFFKDNIE